MSGWEARTDQHQQLHSEHNVIDVLNHKKKNEDEIGGWTKRHMFYQHLVFSE